MTISSWIAWAIILIAQNFAFTFVSRARNSGSIKRHMIASIFSNGIWIVSQMLIFTALFAMMTGKYGLKMAVFTGAYYTVFTMTGSLLAHYHALRTEKGKAAVGANKKYAQIPTIEWDKAKATTNYLMDRVSKLESAAPIKQRRMVETLVPDNGPRIETRTFLTTDPIRLPSDGYEKIEVKSE